MSQYKMTPLADLHWHIRRASKIERNDRKRYILVRAKYKSKYKMTPAAQQAIGAFRERHGISDPLAAMRNDPVLKHIRMHANGPVKSRVSVPKLKFLEE